MLEKLFHSCEDEFTSFINHMSDAVFVMEIKEGPTLHYKAINQAGLDMFRCDHTVIGKRVEDVLGMEDLSYVYKMYKEALASQQGITFSYALGENRTGETTLSPMLDENGNPRYILAVIRDTTAQEEIQRKLEESTQKYGSLVKYNPDAVFEGRFVSANPACEELTGYSIEELYHSTYEKNVAVDDLEKANEHFGRALGGEVQTYIIKVQHKDGHLYDCLVKNVPIYMEGQVTGVYGISKDITPEQKYQASLKNSEERYRGLVDNSPIAVFVHDGFIEYVNDSAVELLGVKGKEQLIGKNFYDFFPYGDRIDMQENHQALLRNETETVCSERQLTTWDGKTLDVEAYTVATVFKDKEILHSVVRDISSHKKLEREVKENEERYRLIAENSTDLIELLDTEGTIIYASPSHARVLAQAPKKWEGKTLETFLHPEDVSLFHEGLEELVQRGEVVPLEIRLAHSDGERWVWIDCELVPIQNADEQLESILFTGGNITDRKNYEEKIHHMAYHDSLTGIPNRRFFTKRLEEVLDAAEEEKQIFALLYLDCDNFKPINDELGHDAGDEFLKSLAEKLNDCTRDSDTIARIGGDEFNILLRGIGSEQEAMQIAGRILDSANTPWEYNGEAYHVSVSIGLALYPEDGDNKDELIKKADQALFAAKEDGKNTIKQYNEQTNPLR